MHNRKRQPSGVELLRGLLRHAPFVLKNFRHYFQNLYRRKILRTNVIAPYAAVLYVTHKCNLACTYCTQKEPDVFSDELSTGETLQLLRIIRRETDSILFTGGEPLLRGDIEELAGAARRDIRFRSVLLVTNGTLLHRRQKLFDSLTSLIVSLDALSVDARMPLSKPGGAAQGAGEPATGSVAHAGSRQHHRQHRDRGVEHWGNRTHFGLLRRAGFRFRHPDCAPRKDA